MRGISSHSAGFAAAKAKPTGGGASKPVGGASKPAGETTPKKKKTEIPSCQ